MDKSSAERELARLVGVARQLEPPALPPLVQRRMVRQVVERAEKRQGRARFRAFWPVAAAALLLLGLATTLWSSGSTTVAEVAAHGLPLRLALRTGDVLLLSPGSKLRVLRESLANRQVELVRGATLFDIAPLGAGQTFEVLTEHGVIRVVGTIFSVVTDAQQTFVRVHEGKVAVHGRLLVAGQTWSSAGEQSVAEPFPSEAMAAVNVRLSTKITTQGAPAKISVQQVAVPSPVVSQPPPASRPKQPAPADASEQAAMQHAGELRAAGLFAEAALAYEALAAVSRQRGSALEAGFAAAQLAREALSDDARALAAVQRFGLTGQAWPLQERAYVLQIDALWSLGRHDEARAVVHDYLARFPETASSRRMRSLVQSVP